MAEGRPQLRFHRARARRSHPAEILLYSSFSVQKRHGPWYTHQQTMSFCTSPATNYNKSGSLLPSLASTHGTKPWSFWNCLNTGKPPSLLTITTRYNGVAVEFFLAAAASSSTLMISPSTRQLRNAMVLRDGHKIGFLFNADNEL